MAFDDWTAPLWDGTSSGGGETLSPAPGWTQTRAGEFGKGSLLEEDMKRRERYLEARKGERR